MNYKWFVGIDISKKTLDVVLYQKELQKKSPHCKMPNCSKGFNILIDWLSEYSVKIDRTLFCMESTGIYGKALANFLCEKADCCIESPLHIKRSLGLTRGKNDKIDAYQIARFCFLHRDELIPQNPSSKTMQVLRCLINERERLVKMRTIDKMIVKELDYEENKFSVARAKNRINSITLDIDQVEQEILMLIKQNISIKRNYDLATSVTGIGLINAVMFSGTSVVGKTRVSKISNKRIKVNLTNGARSAIINDPELKLYYKRKTAQGKEHGTVMNAIKFKLITRVFATVKRGTPYVRLKMAG
jgi:transposase